MLLTNENLAKTIVQIVEREKNIIIDIQNINERYETAANLQNNAEIKAIDVEGAEIEQRYKRHLGEKVMVMAFAVSSNKNFPFN